jgi:hypothetical protein
LRADDAAPSIDDGHRLRVAEPGVSAKIMEGEAIFINLLSGLYYRLDGAGGAMWSLLEAGHTIGETATTVAEWYGVPESRAAGDVRAIAARLLEEKLVVLAPGPPTGPTGSPQRTAGGEYRPPELQRYDDMAELFALDPPLPELPDLPPRGAG